MNWLAVRVRPGAFREAALAALFEVGSEGVHESGEELLTHFRSGTDGEMVAAAVHAADPRLIYANSVSGEVGQNFMSPQAFKADPELTELVRRHTKGTSTQWNPLVAPILPFGIRGVLWYQGEGNRDYPVTYRRMLPALIGDWRSHWDEFVNFFTKDAGK